MVYSIEELNTNLRDIKDVLKEYRRVNEGKEVARNYAVAITDLEKLIAYIKYYLIESIGATKDSD